MALIRRFTIRPDQQAVIDQDIQEKQATVPVEEKLAIEVMVPEVPVAESKETIPVAEPTTEPIPEKITIEEPAKEETVEESAKEETSVEPESTIITATETPAKTTPEEPEKTEKKTKRTRKTTKKTEPAEEKEENPTFVNVTNDLGENKEVTDVIREVMPKYTDTAFDEFKEKLEHDLRLTRFEPNTDTGMMRIILMHMNQCFENVVNEYTRVSTNLEQLTNKNYGLITRQIILNSNGSNEISRKQNGAQAPAVYKTPDGQEINLYALQAALDAEMTYLKGKMQILEYSRSNLISYLTAHKYEAKLIGD